MEASHKTHRPHIKVGKDEEEEEEDTLNVVPDEREWCISKHDRNTRSTRQLRQGLLKLKFRQYPAIHTVEPLLYDHPPNHIDVVV